VVRHICLEQIWTAEGRIARGFRQIQCTSQLTPKLSIKTNQNELSCKYGTHLNFKSTNAVNIPDLTRTDAFFREQLHRVEI